MAQTQRVSYVSDFYRVRQFGRVAAGESNEPVFNARFGEAMLCGNRDFRGLITHLAAEAAKRGYHTKLNSIGDVYSFCASLMSEIQRICLMKNRDAALEATITLYCDVFVAAIMACPRTDGESIYE